jgi:carbon-monoxide dehydrogenase large subunit
VAEDALVVRDGGFEVIDDPTARIALADIAAETDAGLTAEAVYRVERPAYSHGAVAAVVQVDPELGHVRVERLVIGYDVGRAINPRLVEGQLVGAALQALGGTLLEQFAYDEHGTPLASSLLDYLLPTVRDAPDVTVLLEEIPAATNPLGVKGAGEAGIPAVAGAIANAIEAALGAAGLIRAIPIVPETVRDLAYRP